MDAYFQNEDQNTLEALKSYSVKYNLLAEDLYYKWEAFAMQQPGEPEIKGSLEDFQTFLAQDDDRPKKKAKISTPLISRTRQLSTPLRQIQSSATKPATPLPAHIDRSGVLPSSSDMPSSPVAHYSSRLNSGKVIMSLNENNGGGSSLASAPASFVTNVSSTDYNYRPMYQQLSDVGKVLDQQIERMITIFANALDINEADIVNPARLLQDTVIVVGRLGSDEAGYKARLSPKGVVIQTSRRLGGGTQVRLDVSRLGSYSLFPGQIVALKGTNPSGSSFIVSEILTPPALPLAMLPRGEEQDFTKKRGEHPLTIMVAAGPYTTSDDLDFRPLQDFIAKANEVAPSAIVLVGPFLEGDHPMIWSSANNGGQDTLSDIFTQRVAPLLEYLNSTIPIVLVPSTRDIVTENLQFPQPALSRKTLGLPKNFKTVPNPSFFSLDEVVVAATSADSIQDILSSRLFKGESNISGFGQACKHILEQRRVYPLIPGLVLSQAPNEETVFEVSLQRSTRVGTSLDVSHLDLGDLDFAPSLLIVPSLTRPSVEVLDNVICLNPGYLAKKSSGGSYAIVTSTSESGPFSERARVDIVLI